MHTLTLDENTRPLTGNQARASGEHTAVSLSGRNCSKEDSFRDTRRCPAIPGRIVVLGWQAAACL